LGSAGNDYDIPISDQFKIDQFSDDFYTRFEDAVKKIFSNFEVITKLLDPYRELIRNEAVIQKQDLFYILNK
jgi:hypothetical protein